MSTTLVNVGILNGRSTKLDSDDLMVLSDIVENYSTDVLVSTPEIIIPELSSDTVMSVDTMENSDVSVELRAKDLAEQSHVIDETALIESLRFDRGASDSESAHAPHQELISSLAFETAKETENETTSPQNDTPDDSDDLVTIELAKQAAIEAALMAASNQGALAKSLLLQPPAKSTNKAADVESFTDDTIASDVIASDVIAHDVATDELSPVQRAVERMRRENIAVEEITADLLDRLEAGPDKIGVTKKADEKSVAILAPTEKQFDRLVENLLEKTVPGMPSTIMITGCENSSRTGKVASAVAALLAEKNLGKILLIDGDMYEKTLTDSLINSHEPGLIEVLNRQQTLESTVLKSGMQNLYFLPAGIATLSREKTMAGRMAAFNQQLKESFRFVLIDGGNSSEPVCRVFSSFCDSTYLAISLGQTFCATASNAVDDLQAAGSRLLGTIVTK